MVGIPASDLLVEVVAAWTKAGLDAVEILRKSTEITGQFVYDPTPEDIRDRIKPRFVNTKLVLVMNRTLGEVPRTCAHITCQGTQNAKACVAGAAYGQVLDPQPKCSEVLKELLLWIDRSVFLWSPARPRPVISNM